MTLSETKTCLKITLGIQCQINKILANSLFSPEVWLRIPHKLRIFID